MVDTTVMALIRNRMFVRRIQVESRMPVRGQTGRLDLSERRALLCVFQSLIKHSRSHVPRSARMNQDRQCKRLPGHAWPPV